MNFNNSFKIANKTIGGNAPTFIIAEMSGNHGHDLQKAKDIILAAKEAGADAIKLQTYTPDTITLNSDSPHFFIKDGPWRGQTLYQLYTQAYTPWEWHPELKKLANSIGLIFFSSPFDFSSVDFLEALDCPAYKIASPEIIDIPLIQKVARTGKPLIFSTGNATLSEINEAINAALELGSHNIALLKCTSTYPAPPEEINLATIPHMQQSFNCPVGLSDHTLGIGVPIASIGLGASIIEKHFIINRNDDSADNFFSATPDEFKAMVTGIRAAEKAVGKITYPLSSNKPQRSIIVTKNIKTGDVLNEQNIKSLRPGGGLLPKDYSNVLNRKAACNIPRGSLLTWNMVGAYK